LYLLLGGGNGSFALEIANILAEEEGIISVFTVASGKAKFDIEGFVNENKERLHLSDQRIVTKTVNAPNVVEAILEASEEHDLVVLGSTGKPLIYQVARDTIPERVARRCTKPLVMVKAARGIESFLKRWI